MDVLKLTTHLKRYRGSKLEFGVVDCNLIWLELYEPDIYEIMKGRYTTQIGGPRVAKREVGHKTIGEFVAADEKYSNIPREFMSIGDFCTDGVNVSICVGPKSFVLLDDTFQIVPNSFVEGDVWRLN